MLNHTAWFETCRPKSTNMISSEIGFKYSKYIIIKIILQKKTITSHTWLEVCGSNIWNIITYIVFYFALELTIFKRVPNLKKSAKRILPLGNINEEWNSPKCFI